MHKFVEWIFASLINLEKFLRILCVFFIMLLSLYWIQNIIGASWWWMGFISPALEYILDFVNRIYSFSLNFGNITIDMQYFNAILLIIVFIFGLKGVGICIEKLHEIYEDTHFLYKKTNEKIFNNKLVSIVKKEEKQVNSYQLYFQTRIIKTYIIGTKGIDLDSENNKIKRLLKKATGIYPNECHEGFVYSLNNFENVDTVLDALFDIFDSLEYLDYRVCIQIGSNYRKLVKLIDLEEWSKIIISADTLCRYEYNNVKRYKTSNVGIFQKKKNTLEVHEFIKKM